MGLILIKELSKIVLLLMSIAFIILLERKALALLQIRKGPSKNFFKGLLQPLSDFFKLFNKKSNLIGQGFFFFLSIITPFFLGIIFFFLFFSLPLKTGFNPSLVFFWFFFCLRYNRYPIIFAGWYTNCKYSLISCYRRLGQMISYELVLIVFIISLIILTKDLNISKSYFNNMLIIIPLTRFFLITSILIELNRTPFDFSESERELVSGFITEYGGFFFRFFFLCEYGMILFFRLLISYFLSFNYHICFFFFLLIILYRRVLPRTRYDKQIKLS